MALHHVVMQCRCRTQARAEGQTDTGGHGQTRTDVVGDNGKVRREVGGWDAALRGHGVVFVVKSLLTVDVYVHVLANPGTTHGNADEVTRRGARRYEPFAQSL